MISAADIKAILLGRAIQADRKPIEVLTPEWAEFGLAKVWHLTPSPDDLDWYDQRDTELRYRFDERTGKPLPPDLRGLRAEYVARLLCDEEGTLCGFEPIDVIELRRRAAAPVGRIFHSLQKTGGQIGDAVKDAEKNCDAAPGGGSS